MSFEDHYDDERYKIVFYKTPELQDQARPRSRPIFWSQAGLYDRRSQTTSLSIAHGLTIRKEPHKIPDLKKYVAFYVCCIFKWLATQASQILNRPMQYVTAFV